jgi:GNAT superfamily N-acetyltransferase
MTSWTDSGFSIRRATLERDWDDLSGLRFAVERRVRDMGYVTDFARGLDRMAGYVNADRLYVIRQAGSLVASYALTPDADPAFWTAEEQAQDALYLDNAMVHPAHAHRGMGSLITRHARDEAARRGLTLLRLDCQRVTELRAHWERLGFTWLRDVDVPGRSSGTLMETES